MIRVKRAYDPPEPDDGLRFLVDRLWPRGAKKEALALERWAKEAAPSDALRREFHHDAARWDEFQQRYAAELDANPAAWEPLLQAAREGTITLVYSARDETHNQAVALKNYLERKLAPPNHPSSPASQTDHG